ncbi:MAG TPA: hypothetical protein VGI70_11490 [Polyangiales bacterium]
MRCLVETHGGGPNPTQRKQLADIVYKPQLRSAVMTASLVVRGIITALAWAGLPMRSFSLGEQEKAGDWLELTAIEREQVREQLPRMRNEIRTSEALSSTSL